MSRGAGMSVEEGRCLCGDEIMDELIELLPQRGCDE